jgi:hypothetical protein
MQKFLFNINDNDQILNQSDQQDKICTKCSNELSKIRKQLKLENGEPPEDYICPICLKNSEQVKGFGGKNLGPWVVDHNHKTKLFRGWLCHKCNRIFNDDCTKDLLLRAINYLDEK